MKSFGQYAVALMVLTALAVVVNLSAPPLQANNPLQVTVTNTPLPTQVTNLPASQNVNGTVSVANFPATQAVSGTVTLASGASVEVSNTVDNPVRVRNVNDALQPVQFSASCVSSAGTIGCGPGIGYSVPSGKRLVIEYASLNVCALPGQTAVLKIFTSAAGTFVVHSLSSTPVTTSPGANTIGCNGGVASSIASRGEQVRIYADPGTSVGFEADRDNNNGALDATMTISGYLVDVPLTP
jgi:hypothetical protein